MTIASLESDHGIIYTRIHINYNTNWRTMCQNCDAMMIAIAIATTTTRRYVFMFVFDHVCR